MNDQILILSFNHRSFGLYFNNVLIASGSKKHCLKILEDKHSIFVKNINSIELVDDDYFEYQEVNRFFLTHLGKYKNYKKYLETNAEFIKLFSSGFASPSKHNLVINHLLKK